MAHDILGQNFYTDRSRPGWHKINILNERPDLEDKPRSAGEILDIMQIGRYGMVPLYFEVDGVRHTSTHSAITRAPIGTESLPQLLGVVSNDYEPIYPAQAAHLWDSKVKVPVETLGFLANGAKLFISGVMPTISVKGEEVQTYLVLYSPLNGVETAAGYVTATRVVCQNTLHIAQNNSTSTFKVRHHQGAALRLGKWLEKTYQNALTTVQVMQEAFNLLAAKPVKDIQVQWIIEKCYPMPNRPNADVPRKMDFKDVLKMYEYRRDWVSRARSTVEGFYSGGGTGYNSTVAGTAWWAFNAVSEFETYRRGTADSMANNILVGDRARTIRKAFVLANEVG